MLRIKPLRMPRNRTHHTHKQYLSLSLPFSLGVSLWLVLSLSLFLSCCQALCTSNHVDMVRFYTYMCIYAYTYPYVYVCVYIYMYIIVYVYIRVRTFCVQPSFVSPGWMGFVSTYHVKLAPRRNSMSHMHASA